ncbi:MAG: NAD(P)-dependent oxidoreductase [Chloroflexi bacterium]|nr:NAD(P)-dependent oxidoreductase [Chloroflexota bacterium]
MGAGGVSEGATSLKILVTGGYGAVGTPLVQELRQRGHEVWVADRGHSYQAHYMRCDIGEFRQVEALFDRQTFDFVYHLAAEFGRWNGEDFYETMWKSNAIGTKHMIRMQERLGFRMVFTSSSEVYGDYRGVMTEEVLETTPIRQMNDYAISKWVSEMQIMNSADMFGTETVRVRLFNTYGPGEYYSPYRSVICRWIYHALHGEPYVVYTNHRRTSTYIDDTARTLANITDTFKPGEVYNITGSSLHDMKTPSDIILAQLGLDDSLVTYRDHEPQTTREKIVDGSKGRRDLDMRTTVDLEEGIARTIAWQRGVYCA